MEEHTEVEIPIGKKLKFGVMGLVMGAILSVFTAVQAGILITKPELERRVNASILQTRVATCAAEFTHDPHYQEKVKEFNALNFLDRDAFIHKNGWDQIPGEEKTDENIARACGDKLAAAMEKPESE